MNHTICAQGARARARRLLLRRRHAAALPAERLSGDAEPIALIDGGVTGGVRRRHRRARCTQRTESSATPTARPCTDSTPRVTANVAPQRLFGSPVYASLNSEYAYLPYRSHRRRRGHPRRQPRRDRPGADAARAAVAADVSLGQHQRGVPHDLLFAQPRRDAAATVTEPTCRRYFCAARPTSSVRSSPRSGTRPTAYSPSA